MSISMFTLIDTKLMFKIFDIIYTLSTEQKYEAYKHSPSKDLPTSCLSRVQEMKKVPVLV